MLAVLVAAELWARSRRATAPVLVAVPPPRAEPTIKGNAKSMLFHTPASPYYARTAPDRLFASEDEAVAAGFFRWDDPERPRRRK